MNRTLQFVYIICSSSFKNWYKAPYLPNWQRSPLTKAQLETEIRADRCKAVGVLCGTPSGGLLFLDHDGGSCDALIETLSGLTLADALPKTVGVTSGRPGHYQLLYRVPEPNWKQMGNRKLKTGTLGEDGKQEVLEFRWDGCQSIVIGAHPLTGAYQYLPGQSFAECEIASVPLWMVQHLCHPSPPTWNEFCQHIQIPTATPIPLSACLSPANRTLLQGVVEGERDNTGARLARDLLGTAHYLCQIGQPFLEDPKELLQSFCQSCLPPLTKKDGDRLWKSACKDHPQPSLSPEKIEGCIKGWLWRNSPRTLSDDRSLIPTAKNHPPLALSELQTEIRQFLTTAPTDTQLTLQVMEWASRSTKTESTLWSLIDKIQQEEERQQSRPQIKAEIDHLTRLSAYQPPLTFFLPPALSQPLEQIATWMGTTGMAMLTTLLPTACSLLQVGTQLEINPATEYTVFPILYTGIVAESGSGKSPAQKTILKPLFRLQAEADEAYRIALSDWETESRTDPEAFRSPKPKPRDYFTTDATREAVIQIQTNQPDHGFLGWFDELSALIRSQNQYRNGRGADKESLLSGRDSSAQKVDRASGKRLFIARSSYSITGSTQPDTLRSLMGDFSDPSGQWARFLWCYLPVRPAPFPDQALHFDVSGLLYDIYQRLSRFPPLTYRFSPAAHQAYIHWYNQLDQLRLSEVKQSLRAVYAKFKGDTGVLALVLHCLNATILGHSPATEIPLTTLQAAIGLSKFFLGQVKLIHAEGEALADEQTPNYCKILSLSQRKGWITARDIYRARAVSDRKASLEQIRGLMRELVTMGLAEARNAGNRLEIRSFNAGDSLVPPGDNLQIIGNSPPPQGDSPELPGDRAAPDTDSDPEPTQTVTAIAIPITTAKASVTSAPTRVTTLDRDKQVLNPLAREEFGSYSVSTVTTEKPRARPPTSRRPLQAGDLCRYHGPDGVMKVTCAGKDLQVLAVENGIATVKASQWVHTYQLETRHLRKVK